MTKKTRRADWVRLFATILPMVCGLAGCDRGPTAPSTTARSNSAPTLSVPPPTPSVAPSILSITPSIGSIGGGSAIRITGSGLLPGARVSFGATVVSAYFYRDGLNVTTPNHESGAVDVMVTNVDGQNAVATGAYTFAAPDSFDFNGVWRGVTFVGDYDYPFAFTVVNGAVVSMTCATSGTLALSPPAPVIHGEFSFAKENIVTVYGRIVAPKEAIGVVDIGTVGSVGPCVRADWHATKE